MTPTRMPMKNAKFGKVIASFSMKPTVKELMQPNNALINASLYQNFLQTSKISRSLPLRKVCKEGIFFSKEVRSNAIEPFTKSDVPLVKDTSEATLDSRYLIMASDMGAAKAKAMKNDAGGFDVDDFVSKLITFMGGRRGGMKEREGSESVEPLAEEDEDDEDDGSNLDWEKVGRLGLAKSHRVPVIDFMCVFSSFIIGYLCISIAIRLGPLSIEQKQRKKNIRPKFEKNKEPERAPQQVQSP
jgi:hypothetical protein